MCLCYTCQLHIQIVRTNKFCLCFGKHEEMVVGDDAFELELDRVWISSGLSLVASLGFGFKFFGFQNSKMFRVRVFRL